MHLEFAALQAAQAILQNAVRGSVTVESKSVAISEEIEYLMKIGDLTFAVEITQNLSLASVMRGIETLKAYAKHNLKAEPLLIVPRMNEASAKRCEEAGINWIDLRGNASIQVSGLTIFIGGSPAARSFEVDRESTFNPFSKKASRVAQTLLRRPQKPLRREELLTATGLEKGFLSRILSELKRQELVLEQFRGQRVREISVPDPVALLDAWSEFYEASKPYAWGILATRDGFETLSAARAILDERNVGYKITGLPAAAGFTAFGSFRRVDFYVSKMLPQTVTDAMRLGSASRGRTIAFTVDPFQASFDAGNLSAGNYADPAIVYLDLERIPERSEEARAELRKYLVSKWTA